ncbi:kinase-like domain-containing protein [Rhizophagus irregularis DAOM 181602=DAOM 197198]|nr:kinase-like domain-containing protein [Rhizophagus irregularis DAOM 181602=DAOM 197198]
MFFNNYFCLSLENHDNNINYMLVMEYADSGNLQNYLKYNFSKLTWDDKYLMAYQLACAVSCLHNEGIVHRDLHSGNILVHQHSIKLADFGEQYDVSLALEIGQGLRETIIPDTPEDYVKIYTRCWGGKPDNRPTIYQVVDWLKEIITKTDVKAEILQSSSKRELNLSNAEVPLSTSNSESQGELSQPIQNFNKMSTEVINTTSLSNESQKDLLLEKDFNKIVDEINDFIIELLNKGIEGELVKDQVIEYLSSNYNTNSQEIFDWLSNNQINSNSVFLLGYFNYNGIETNENNEKAFNLFLNASAKYHTLAQYFVAYCYQNGFGTIKNDKLAFKYFEKVADKNYAMGQLEVGYFYDNGIGIKKDLKKAFIWFEKAVNNGNIMAKCNLGLYYKNGKDRVK